MDIPQCYGEYWEGLEGSACMACHIKGDCLARFATGKLVKVQQQLGEKATPKAIAEATGIAEAAIVLALQFQKNVGLNKSSAPKEAEAPAPPMQEPEPMMPPPQDAPVVTEPPPPPPISEEEPGEPEGSSVDGEEAIQKEGTENVKKPKKASKKPAKKAVAKPKKTAKKPAKKTAKKSAKKPAKKPAKKKTAAKNPPMAGTSAKPVTVPAKPKKGKSATSASEQAGDRTWSPEHDQSRWERERERSPVLAKLKPGQKLRREWPLKSGEQVEVKVLKGRYRFQGKDYPTLYSVVKEITGTKLHQKQLRPDGSRPEGKRKLSAWSATKFFRKALENLGCFDK